MFLGVKGYEEKGMKELDLKEYMLFHVHRNIASLFKSYLVITEDLQKEHEILLKKVEEELGSDFAKNIDYFDSNKYTYIRKKILDTGNEILRDIDRHFDLVDVELNSDKIKKLKEYKLSEISKFNKKSTITCTSDGQRKFKGKLI